ncbi:MAG: hypothetical protein Fur0032_18350 [Terrimicrobiaceae bacterium]
MNTARVQYLLETARNLRLLVIGDVMLDEFVWGRVSRISPEAPVPVVEVTGESLYPGGAANVARNLRPFCESVEICGLVGQDTAADRLEGLLGSEGIVTSGIIRSQAIPTIVKTRIVARQQQVVRVDREKRGVAPEEARSTALAWIASRLPQLDGIIFEDYAKGLLDQNFVTQVSQMAVAAGKPVTADPNPNNRLSWQGVSVLKPNRLEAFAMVGLPDPGAADNPLEDTALLHAAKVLMESQQVGALLVTLGEHGMLLVQRDHPPYHTPTRAREVFDVSGAGDTAIAVFTLALCAGATLPEAAELSNHASGIVVGKLGTATILPAELTASIQSA